jgi:hypothetical protein
VFCVAFESSRKWPKWNSKSGASCQFATTVILDTGVNFSKLLRVRKPPIRLGRPLSVEWIRFRRVNGGVAIVDAQLIEALRLDP